MRNSRKVLRNELWRVRSIVEPRDVEAGTDIHRELMLYYYCIGNRPAALCQFVTCARLLQAELAIRPMADTLDLFEAIQAECAPSKLLSRRTIVNGQINGQTPAVESRGSLPDDLQELADQIENARTMLKQGLASLEQLLPRKPNVNPEINRPEIIM